MVKLGIPRRSRSEAAKLGNSPPFKLIEVNIEPSEDLAYVLGVLKGDGCIDFKNKSGRIRLSQTRSEFAISFETALKNIGFNPHTSIDDMFKRKNSGFGRKAQYYYVTYGYSIKFAQWYKQLSLEDIEKILGDKSEFIEAFIRGFYESEGCNYIRPQRLVKKWKGTSWTIKIEGTNGELYDLVERLLIKLGFNFGRGYRDRKEFNWKPIHILRSSKQLRNYRFIEEIAPCIKNQVPLGSMQRSEIK